jgi:hypothetical protein
VGAERAIGPEGKRVLRAAYIAARQADASPAYDIATLDGRLHGENPAQGLHIELDRELVRVETERGEALELSFAGIGREGQVRTPPEAKLAASGNRVTYTRGEALEEWYLNGPLGLEQGFVVVEPPVGERGEFVIEVTVDGLEPRLVQNGADVLLRDADGTAQLRYRDLFAFDDDGKVLPARMGVIGSTIALHIEDADATYPVFVDPLFEHVHTFIPSDSDANAEFGYSVSIDGDYAIVGAESDGSEVGSAYVFERDVLGAWSEAQHLEADDAAGDDYFGASVDISGDYAIVGAYGNDIVTYSDSYGSAYVYFRNGGAWDQELQLLPSPGSADEGFGRSVAIDGDYAVVGAYRNDTGGTNRGAAYVFKRDGSTWPPDPVSPLLQTTEAEDHDYFGYSVDISGTRIIVGAPKFHHSGTMADAGAAFVFEWTVPPTGPAEWVEYRLQGTPPLVLSAYDEFGHSVAIWDDFAIVGAHFDDSKGNKAGAAYVFPRGTGPWTLPPQKILAYDGATDDLFGSSVSISGQVAVVGAPGNGAGGSVYPFEFDTSGIGWTAGAKLADSAGADGDDFGYSVRLSGDDLVIGAPGDGAGVAHVYLSVLPNGDPCSDGVECESGYCVDGVCCVVSECEAPGGCYRCNVSGSLGACAYAVGEVCRAGSGDMCDPREECESGNDACPEDEMEEEGVVCRAGSDDDCDPDEVCSGLPGDPCPSDVILPLGTVCRSGSGDDCDPDEECFGNAGVPCPTDVFEPDTTVCNPGSGETGLVVCDPDEFCPGVPGQGCPEDVIEPATTECREGSGDICDPPEKCTGVADAPCPEVNVLFTGVCREGGDDCDPDETCTGTPGEGCPPDEVAPPGTPCGDSAGACDAVETCYGDGSACPMDLMEPGGTECREAVSECDLPEYCDGQTAECPEDRFVRNNTPCDDGNRCTKGEVCEDGVCGQNDVLVPWWCCNALGAPRGSDAGWLFVLGLIAVTHRRRRDRLPR